MAGKNKDTVFQIRISENQLSRWRDAAGESGLSLSAWIRIRCDGVFIQSAASPRHKAA